MKLPTPGRWYGLIASYFAYNLVWLGLVLANVKDYKVFLAAGFILQSVVCLIALVALFRPHFTESGKEWGAGLGSKAISILLIAAFLSLCVQQTQAQADVQAQAQLNVQPLGYGDGGGSGGEPQIPIGSCIAAAVIIGIGVGGCIVIIYACNKYLPTPPPPPVPPPPLPPPPPAVNTNTVPSTNSMPTTTSTQTRAFDIRAYGWMDYNTPTPAVYHSYYEIDCTTDEVSLVLNSWGSHTLQCWVSSSGVMMTFLNWGIPTMNSYTAGQAVVPEGQPSQMTVNLMLPDHIPAPPPEHPYR